VRPDVAVTQSDGQPETASTGHEVDEEAGAGDTDGSPGTPTAGASAQPTTYYAQFNLDAVRAVRQLDEILHNVIEHLQKAGGANVRLSFEINATASGFDDRTRRVVNENATQLGAKSSEFE
jgi:hypothetical protein